MSHFLLKLAAKMALFRDIHFSKISKYTPLALYLMLGIGLVLACQKTYGSKVPDIIINEPSRTATATSTHKKNESSEHIHLTPVVTFKALKYATPSYEIRQTFVKKVDRNRVLNDLRKLTGMEQICTKSGCYTIQSRETGSEGLKWTKEYVYGELRKSGYTVEFQNWSRRGYSDQNIIVKKMGKVYSADEIYFVAHMDGIENSPAADDNASGVVDLLELARILSEYSTSKTIVFLFSTGEEHGVLGVQSYVDQLSLEEINAIKYVVDIDMVGYDSDGDGVMQLWSGDHNPSRNFSEYLMDLMKISGLKLVPQIVTGCT